MFAPVVERSTRVAVQSFHAMPLALVLKPGLVAGLKPGRGLARPFRSINESVALIGKVGLITKREPLRLLASAARPVPIFEICLKGSTPEPCNKKCSDTRLHMSWRD